MQLVIMQVHTVSDFGSFSTHHQNALYVLRIIVSKLGDIGEVLGCSTRFKHGGGSVQTE